MDKRINQKEGRYFTETEKHKIIKEFLSGTYTKQELWQRHTGQEEEHGQLLRWMRQLGYDTGIKIRIPTFVTNTYKMSKRKKKEDSIDSGCDSYENLQLKKRVAELEKQLKEAELKAIAFATMVDIAEKEFNIPIKKKYNTKL